MNGYILVAVIFLLALSIIWHTYYTHVTKEVKLAKAERINKLVRAVNYIDRLSQNISIIPTTSLLYRILYSRQISFIEEIEKEAPDSPYVNETLPAIQEKLDEIENFDIFNGVSKQRNLNLPASEEEANEVCKVISSILHFIARERKYIDSRFLDVHKERERLLTMMVQIKCEMLYNRSVISARFKKRGDEIFYLEKALDLIFKSDIDNASLSSLKLRLETTLEKANFKKQEATMKIEDQPDDSGLDRVTSNEKLHWR